MGPKKKRKKQKNPIKIIIRECVLQFDGECDDN